eukprot:766979-Hanusia_phi.AAC.7
MPDAPFPAQGTSRNQPLILQNFYKKLREYLNDSAKWFHFLDKDKDGRISYQDVVRSCDELKLIQPDLIAMALFESRDASADSNPNNGRVPDSLMAAMKTIASALDHNGFSVFDGYKSFDVDMDGKMSFQDLENSCRDWNLEIGKDRLKELFLFLESDSSGYVDYAKWKHYLDECSTEASSQSGGAASGSAQMRLVTGRADARNVIAAAIEFNQISLTDAYVAFDVDGDGILSWQDLEAAADTLQLDIPLEDLKKLFEELDTAQAGYIGKEAWNEMLAGADGSE